MNPFIISYIIMGISVLVSYLCFENRALFEKLKHSPYREANHGEYYRLLTSGFVHGSWMHLGINMFVFYSFGRFTEGAMTGYYGGGLEQYSFDPILGHLLFLGIYLLTIVIANLATLFEHKLNPGYASIGASGAVSGALFCFILYLPWEIIELYFVIKIPAILVGVGFLVYSHYAAQKGDSRIDHSAHFFGAIAMPALLMLFRPGLVSHFFNSLLNDLPF